MKNKYILGSVLFLLLLFIIIMFVLPNSKIEKTAMNNEFMTKVFDKSKVTTVDIVMNDQDLQDILDNPLDEEMVKASVVINGKKMNNVGIRTKGNMTLRSVANIEDSNRYSFKIDFDKYEDQSLYGLRKLNLNNGYSDSTQIREYMSYALMEEMGVPTPQYSYMYVTINGEEYGLYLGVEAIEEPFLQNHFVNGTGDLYKPDGVGSDLNWISDDIDDYSGLDLKTNAESSDQSAMMKMLKEINTNKNIEGSINIDEMLRYFAASTALVNLDSYQGTMKHNYYLYEEDGKFSILPWDLNMAFAGYPVGNRPTGQMGNNGKNVDTAQNANEEDPANYKNQGPGNMGGMGSNLMSEENINFSISSPVSGVTLEDRPLLNALLSNDQNRKTFNNYLMEIANGFFSEKNMIEMTSKLSALLKPYIEKDPTKFYTVEQFEEGISGENSLVAFAAKRAESILAQISGELVVETNTSLAKGSTKIENSAQNSNKIEENQQKDNEDQSVKNGAQPNMGYGQGNGNMQPPNMENGEGNGNMQPPNMGNGNIGPIERGDRNNRNYSLDTATYSKETIAIYSIFFLLLIGGMIFVFRFKRRK